MLVTDLSGKEYSWRIKGKEIREEDIRPRSNLHISARALIKERFPTMQVLEEVPFYVRGRKTLYLDFFLPLRKLAIEVHGQQHFAFNTLFHASRIDFLNQRKNDQEKAEWCLLNHIELIVLSYDNEANWKNQL